MIIRILKPEEFYQINGADGECKCCSDDKGENVFKQRHIDNTLCVQDCCEESRGASYWWVDDTLKKYGAEPTLFHCPNDKLWWQELFCCSSPSTVARS